MNRPPGPPPAGAQKEVDGQYERACDLADAGRHVDAEALFREAAASGHPHAWRAIGNSLRALDRLSEASQAFRTAAESGDHDAFLNLGQTHEDLHDWTAAQNAYQQARTAGDPLAVTALANLWRRQDDPIAATALLRQAAAAGDPHAAGYLGVWLCHDNHDNQGPDVETLLSQGADVDDDARSALAWILRGRGELDEAEELLRRGVRTRHPDSGIKLALLLEEDRGDLTAAEAVLRETAEAGELHAWNNLGLLLWNQRRFLQAQECLQQGATGGDALAAHNLKTLHTRRRRQLNRAHRRLARQTAPKNQA